MKSQPFKSIMLLCTIHFAFCIYSNAQVQQNNIRVVDTIYTPVGYPQGPLTAKLWLPSISNGAAVIMVHFLGGNPDDLHLWGDVLSSYGYVALSIEYYAFENSFGVPNLYPGPVLAIKTAAEFLRKNSLQFGCYSGKVAAIGNSAGAMHIGQTIIWDNDDAYFGTNAGINDHLDAAILFYGWYDYYNHLESIFNSQPGSELETLVSGYFSPDPLLRATKGNPFTNINNITTPILMFHGTGDQVLNVNQSIEFRDSLMAHGKNVRLELVAGADHVYEFHNSHPLQNWNFNQWSSQGTISKDTAVAWLARVLQVNNIHCPYGKSYWKNHPEIWNGDATPMMLGTTNSYTKPQLLVILNSSSGDPSIKLAQDLISAKLNLANNSYAPPIVSAIIAADNLIGTRVIPISPAIASNSTEGNQMTALGNSFQSYNNGLITPNCNNGTNISSTGNKKSIMPESVISAFSIYPNPIIGSATISFSVAESQKISIKIFDMAGRLVKTLVNTPLQQGNYQLVWDANNNDGYAVPAGVYFLKMISPQNKSQTQKIIVTK